MTQAQSKPTEHQEETELADEIIPESTPSWFARTYGDASAKEMADQYLSHRSPAEASQPVVAENAAAYEAYRKRLEERFSTAQRTVDPDFMTHDNVQHDSKIEPPGPAFPRRPSYAHATTDQLQPALNKKRALGLHPAAVGFLALAACGLGGGAGYFGANPDTASQLISKGYALANLVWSKDIIPTSETVIAKKPVRTAKLEVRDASGAINAPIPLDISAIPADLETPVAFRISGLPPAAYLTKGVEVTKGEWVLKAADVAQAELVVPHADKPEIALQVAALEEKTGAPAAPSQDLMVALDLAAVPIPGVPQPKADVAVIEPAAAMADQGFNKQELPLAVPLPLESANPEAQSLISKGERLLSDGDILAARQFFLRAFELKATLAAYGVGQTYDPQVYAKHKIKGLAPNTQQAAEWYGKAAAIGHAEAAAALSVLTVQVQP